MTFTLKTGQTLTDIFPRNKWKVLFPGSRSPETRKRLNAEQYIGILKIQRKPTTPSNQPSDD